MLEKEWIIEEYMTEEQYEQAKAVLMQALDRHEQYYRRDFHITNAWQKHEANLGLKAIRRLRGEMAFGSSYRPWVPTYLFRPVLISLYEGAMPSTTTGWDASQVAKLVPYKNKVYKTTLERCVELWREIESILPTKQLRIRNVHTDEVIPCEAFG